MGAPPAALSPGLVVFAALVVGSVVPLGSKTPHLLVGTFFTAGVCIVTGIVLLARPRWWARRGTQQLGQRRDGTAYVAWLVLTVLLAVGSIFFGILLLWIA